MVATYVGGKRSWNMKVKTPVVSVHKGRVYIFGGATSDK